MRKLILATCIVVLTSFCTKETEPPMACTITYDWTYLASLGIPNYQGGCYAMTNEQIRWLQLNSYIPNTSTAPDNKTCPTKSQFEAYIGGFDLMSSEEYVALSNSNLVPFGYWYPNL